MLTIPSDLSSLTVQQLRELQGSAIQDLVSTQGLDFITASRRARVTYPAIYAELQKRADDAARDGHPPVLCNDADKARIVQFTPSPENYNRLGLHPAATDAEFAAATKAAGTDLANPNYEKAFDALSDLAQRDRNISGQAADSAISIRHTNLAKKANMQRVARQLQQDQPDANGGFQKVKQATSSSPTPGSGSGLNTGKTGLGAFDAKNYPLGNDADVNCGLDAVKRGWDDQFPEPLTSQSRSLIKYIVNLLSRTDPMPNTVPAYSLAVLQKKLNSPTVSEAALADAKADADAIGNSLLTALANSSDERSSIALVGPSGPALKLQGGSR
jgi:hypothetical protein